MKCILLFCCATEVPGHFPLTYCLLIKEVNIVGFLCEKVTLYENDVKIYIHERSEQCAIFFH